MYPRTRMTPTTVKMAASIKELAGADPGSNIIYSPYKGWSNLHSGYLLGPFGLTLGQPRNGSYMIRNYSEGEPRWSQPPRKLYSTGFNAIISPVQSSPTAPNLEVAFFLT